MSSDKVFIAAISVRFAALNLQALNPKIFFITPCFAFVSLVLRKTKSPALVLNLFQDLQGFLLFVMLNLFQHLLGFPFISLNT